MNDPQNVITPRIVLQVLFFVVLLPFLPLLISGRYNWSQDFDMPLKIIALIVILAGNILGTYALMENRFFSGVVRLQTDRGQHVVSSGSYRWVRHPGYAGALLTYWGAPIFLGSLWMFIPVMFITVILVVRTNLEDNTLQEKLDGYREYAGRVRYRLLPGVW